MSKFYACHKGIEDYVAVFPTEEERNNWVNCSGKFDCGFSKESIEETGFIAIPLDEKEAKKRIKIHNLKKTFEEDILGNEILIYSNPNKTVFDYLGG